MFVQLAYCILRCFVVYYYQSRGDETECQQKSLCDKKQYHNNAIEKIFEKISKTP